MPKASVTKDTFWTKAKQHKRFYFTDGSQNSADGERNPTGYSSLPSLSPPNIYMSACVCAQNSEVSWRNTQKVFTDVSILWTISHCPFLEQKRSSQGWVPERESGSTCLFMGLPLTCDMSLDRRFFDPFSSPPMLCPLYFSSKILREETLSASDC